MKNKVVDIAYNCRLILKSILLWSSMEVLKHCGVLYWEMCDSCIFSRFLVVLSLKCLFIKITL